MDRSSAGSCTAPGCRWVPIRASTAHCVCEAWAGPLPEGPVLLLQPLGLPQHFSETPSALW